MFLSGRGARASIAQEAYGEKDTISLIGGDLVHARDLAKTNLNPK